MRKSIRRVLYRLLPASVIVPLVLLFKGNRAGLLRAHGYARSVRRMLPLDDQGAPIPYLPYCAVDLLAERLTPDLTVLEFGAGYSTMFFAQRVARVISVEHNAGWLEIVKTRVPVPANVLHAPRASADSYTAPVRARPESYDLILVDGVHRVACFALALDRLTDRGVIVLDDSDRPEYEPVFEPARNAGFRVLHLRGHKADSVHLHRTSFFYRDGNCLGI